MILKLKQNAKSKAFTGSLKHSLFVIETDTVSPASQWDGGSRSQWTFINLDDKIAGCSHNKKPYDFKIATGFLERSQTQTIPLGCIVLETGISCGKPMTPYIRCNPEDVSRLREFLGI